MPFYLAWIYSNFSRWNFKFFSISDLSYGTNQDFMPFIQAQFFVARYPQKLHSVLNGSFSTNQSHDYSNFFLLWLCFLVSLPLLSEHEVEFSMKYRSNYLVYNLVFDLQGFSRFGHIFRVVTLTSIVLE